MRRQVSAGLTFIALALAAPVATRAAVTPDYFPVTGQAVGIGIAADAAGSVWYSQGQGTYAYLGRLDTTQAVPGTSNGMSMYTTPKGSSCCATAIRGLAMDDARQRVWFVRNDGYVGFADPAAVVNGTDSGMHTATVPGGVALESIAVGADGRAWFTEYGTSNVAPYPGDRVASIDGSLGITESQNLALQASTSLDPLRYDAKPSGIAIDAAGVPWFTEANPGFPGYRIARTSGGGYQEYLITPCYSASPCSGTYVGTGPTGVAIAPDGAIWFTNQVDNSIGRLDPVGGTFTRYPLTSVDPTLAGGTPRALRTAVDGTLWLAEYGSPVGSNGANAIVRILPGNSAGGASATVFHLGSPAPFNVAPDTNGNVWFPYSTATTSGIGRLAGVVTPAGGETTPPAATPTPAPAAPAPAPVPSSTPLVASAVGVATVGNPAVHGTAISAHQICVGPPQDRCSLVYLLDTNEYVNGFPGNKASAATKPRVRRVTVGKLTVTLTGGQSKTVKIALNAKGRKLLKSYKRLPVNLTVTQRLANGKTKTIKHARVTFKR